jgi:hypothetical protein
MEVPNPEQTASLLSMVTYRFLDPLVFTAYKVKHLAWDQLPPLNDNDQAHVLKERSFKVTFPVVFLSLTLAHFLHHSTWIFTLALLEDTFSSV